MRDEFDTSHRLLFKEKLFYELAFQGRLSVNFETGEVFNNVMLRMMGYTTNCGYKAIAWKYNFGTYHILIHRLIWLFANGPVPQNKQINHIDGVKTNNKLINLELMTPSQNLLHAYKTGLISEKIKAITRKKLISFYRHNRHPSAKLANEEIRKIIELRNKDPKKYTLRKLARMFNIHHSEINRILKGRSYRHVK